MPPEGQLGGCPCAAYTPIDGGNDVLVLWHLPHVAIALFCIAGTVRCGAPGLRRWSGHLFGVTAHPYLARTTMRRKPLFPLASFTLLATMLTVSPSRLEAQAPPGPLPAAQPTDGDR